MGASPRVALEAPSISPSSMRGSELCWQLLYLRVSGVLVCMQRAAVSHLPGSGGCTLEARALLRHWVMGSQVHNHETLGQTPDWAENRTW